MAQPWSEIEPGSRFRISSFSGRTFESIFLAAGPLEAGLYVRLEGKSLARLSPDRLDWKTLARLLPEELLLPGDELLFETGGRRRRGRLLESVDDRIVMTGTADEPFERLSAPLSQIAPSSVRLLFAPTDLRCGDEFLVKSLSGREYRGLAKSVNPERIGAQLAGTTEENVLRVQHLDLKSLRVLVPLTLSVLGCSPVA